MKIFNRLILLIIFTFWAIPHVIIGAQSAWAGNYPEKWYGWHCPFVEVKDLKGMLRGEAFPEQVVINAWGYKAGNIEEIKDLLPEGFLQIILIYKIFRLRIKS